MQPKGDFFCTGKSWVLYYTHHICMRPSDTKSFPKIAPFILPKNAHFPIKKRGRRIYRRFYARVNTCS